MSDRHAGFVVTLDKDLKDEDAEEIANAIRCLQHVITVRPVVSNIEMHILHEQVRHELMQKLWDVLKP
jgi:hypothetical protein